MTLQKLKASLARYIYLPDLIVAGLIALYCLGCFILATATGYGKYFTPLMYTSSAAIFSSALLILYVLYRLLRIYYIMIFIRPDDLKGYLWKDLKAGPLNRQRLKQAPVILVAFVFFLSTFTGMKILLSEIHPFAWDEAFAAWDRIVHFGTDPWRLLQPVLGYPLVTKIIAFVYILWFPGIFAVMYWQLFSLKNPELRLRFFLTLVLAWGINGTFLATFLSSAGPCFFENVTGSDYYAPLMEYLRSVNQTYNIYALTAQQVLWDNFASRGTILAGGISAMPSIHVTVTFLFVLLGYHWNRAALIILSVFFAFILIGSVHLSWHYAIDGYVAMITTYIIWKIVGVVVRKYNLAAVPVAG